MSTFKIYPIRLGHSEIPETFVVKGGHTATGDVKKIWFAHGFYAAKNNETGEVTLLDTGSGHWKFCEENDLLPYKTNVEKGPDAVEALAKVGIKPEDIKQICITHLHHDHAANLWLFPKDIPIYVQRAELANAVAPYEAQKWDYTFQDHPKMPYWKEHMTQMIPVDGDFEVEPGLKLLFTPGHTYGSQSIMVDTEDGTYIYVGDLFYVQENVEGKIHTNFIGQKEWNDSRKKVLATGAKLLWLHDMKFFDQEYYG